MSNYLVTGGAGFIGSHLVHRFVEAGHRVRVLDNFLTGKHENLAEVAGRVDLIDGDLCRPEDCKRACDGIDVVFHEGARPSVPMSVERPDLSHDVNVNGTFNILMAARDAKVKRLVYAASSSAYGEAVEPSKHEGIVPTPLSPYAVNKLVGEHYLRAFYECYGLETISLRYFNVFGPRQDPKSQYAAAIPAFVSAILREEPPTIYGDGEQTRDFTYIDNVVHANRLAAEAKVTHGEVINAACGNAVTVNQVISLINELLGKNVKPNHVPDRAGDIKHSLADISLAKKVIGYEPIVSFDEGLRQAIDWYRENPR
jgi:UDP-glucose 4-epimerase